MKVPATPTTTRRDAWHVNGVDLAVTVAGSGPLVVLAHGFPDLAITWRLQVPALVQAGYRVVAPDMRGYGGSSRPAEPDAYGSDVIGRDLVALLDHEGAERAHFVGHDWGAASVWPLGLTHPDRVLSLTGLSVPYAPPTPVAPTEIFRERLGDGFYMLRFQERGTPEAMLERDVRRTLVALFSGRLDLDGSGGPDTTDAPEWLPEDVLAAYVREFERTGFGGGLDYYRNLDANWRLAAGRERRAIEAPSLFVAGDKDPVLTFMSVDRGAGEFRRLRSHLVEGAGHWVHQEEPERVNALLLDHLRGAPG